MTAEESTKYLNSKRRSTVFIIVFVAVMAVLAIDSLSVNNFNFFYSAPKAIIYKRFKFCPGFVPGKSMQVDSCFRAHRF